MKLTYFQLAPQLQKSLASIYLISGDEPILKADAITLIKSQAQKSGFIDRVKFTPESNTDWDKLHLILSTSSLFAEKQLIELNFSDTQPNKTAGEILKSYVENISSHKCVLIDLPKIDDKIAKSDWFKAFDKNGVHVAIWPITHDQLPTWLMQRAKLYQIQLSHDAAKRLADDCEGNLAAAQQIIEKCRLLGDIKLIDNTTIDQLLCNESRYTVFDLVDALLARNAARALKIMQNLQQDAVEPIIILWAITRELRLLNDILLAKHQGESFDAICKKYRIFARRQTLIRDYLKKMTPTLPASILTKGLEIDRIIKGVTPGNAWDALTLYALRMIYIPITP